MILGSTKPLIHAGETVSCPRCRKELYYAAANIHQFQTLNHHLFKGIGIPDPLPKDASICPYCFIKYNIKEGSVSSFVTIETQLKLAKRIFNINMRDNEKLATEVVKRIAWQYQGCICTTRAGWVPANPHPPVRSKAKTEKERETENRKYFINPGKK